MNKKSIIIISIFILLFCILGIGIYSYYFKEKKITEFYHNDTNAIQSIQVINGNNGNTININKDDVRLNSITNYLSGLLVVKMSSPPYSGWGYCFVINFENTNVKFEISGERCNINGTLYRITNNTENINDIYKSLLQ